MRHKKTAISGFFMSEIYLSIYEFLLAFSAGRSANPAFMSIHPDKANVVPDCDRNHHAYPAPVIN